MRRMAAAMWMGAALLVGTACDGGSGAVDGGAAADAASALPDAGASSDAGAAPDAGTADSGSSTDAGTGTDAGSTVQAPPPRAGCGDGQLDSLEVCDGELIQDANTCDDNWLGTGWVACTERCSLDFSGCEDTDYCANNGFYGDADGFCEACELLGGHADPDCADHCGADGICADWYDKTVAAWSCQVTGFGPDPDCICGNGVVEGNEYCDGNQYRSYMGQVIDTCEEWGYAGGTLGCLPDCLPDFTGCTR